MASEYRPAEDMNALREDLLEACRHHQEAATHQQNIRDRLFTLYLIASWVTLLLLGVVQVVESRWLPASRSDLCGVTVALCGFAFVAILGLIFLAVYLLQVVNYHLHYLTIARIYECLGKIHGEALSRLQSPDPFAFSYGRYRSLSIDNPDLGPTRVRRVMTIAKDARLLGADFWSNCIHIFFVSVSVGGCAACAGMALAAVAVTALLSFVILILVRQIGLALLLSLATKDYETRWAIGN